MKTSTTKCDFSTCDGSITSRNKVRIAFLEREKKETASYISDLESTLVINKAIIQDLCQPSQKESSTYKAAIAKLNEENICLQRQVKNLKKQRDEALGKVLILEQVIEELKAKEQEQVNELKEKNAELLEQLNLKEYHLQVFEKRCHDAEILVLKYLRNVPEAIEAIGCLQSPVHEGVGISNVVIQNSQMKAKMNELTSEINRLKKEAAHSEAKKLVGILKGKINALVEENEGQRQKLSTQTKMNQELYDLNEKLSAQLSNLNKQVSVLMHSQRITHAETVHTQRSRDPPPEIFYTQEIRGKKNEESFGELSSISMDAVDKENYLERDNEDDEDNHVDINQIGDDVKLP